MKNLYTIVFILLSFFYFSSVLAQGQDPVAKKILDDLSNKYRNMGQYKASYEYKLSNKNDEVFASEVGNITVKGDKFKIADTKMHIYFNGNTVWVYEKEVNEVNVSNKEDMEGEITPANVYKLYKSGYKYIFWGQLKTENGIMQIVELQPERKNSQSNTNEIVKIKLFIDKDSNTLRKIVVIGTADIKQTYTIKKITTDVNPADSEFVFSAGNYPGVKVIDLR